MRSWSLIAALSATVAAAGWVGGQNGDVAAPVEPVAPRERPSQGPAGEPAARPGAAESLDLEKLQQRAVSREFGDIFAERSWLPPPPPPAKPAPPRAPPLPFTYFGRMEEEGKTTVFLLRNEQSFAVKAGDTLVGSYRVEEIGPTTVVLTYLPLKQRQVLNIGAIN